MEVQNHRRRGFQAALGYEKVFGLSLIDYCLPETKMVQLGPMLEVWSGQVLAVSCVLRDYKRLKNMNGNTMCRYSHFRKKAFNCIFRRLLISGNGHGRLSG